MYNCRGNKIKDHPVISYKTGISKDRLNIRWVFPFGMFSVVIPCLEWLSDIGMPLPKLFEFLSGYDSH